VLLPQEANTLEHLPRPAPRRVEPFRQESVLALELLYALRGDRARSAARVELLDLRFRLQRSAAETRELVTQMTHELLELGECFFRTYAV